MFSTALGYFVSRLFLDHHDVLCIAKTIVLTSVIVDISRRLRKFCRGSFLRNFYIELTWISPMLTLGGRMKN